MSWSHHRTRPSRRRRPPPPASKPPPRARPRSALSLRWRPPLGPWRSTSRSWSSTRPQTSNSKVGRKKEAPDWSGAGGGLDLGRAVGVEGMSAAGARVSVPSPTGTFILRPRLAPALGPPAQHPGPLPPAPARTRCARRPRGGGGVRPWRRRHLAVPRGRLLVLPALLPAPGTCPWPPRAVGRCLGGRGWAVILELALWSAVDKGS